VVERYGKPYCKIHDPEYIKEKERKAKEKWDKEMKARNRGYKLERLGREVFGDIEDLSTISIDKYKAAEDMYEALKNLPEPKSLLADAAYTGGDVPKSWIRDRGNFNDGYNQALKEVAFRNKQALALAEDK